jgi:hypothetical protein
LAKKYPLLMLLISSSTVLGALASLDVSLVAEGYILMLPIQLFTLLYVGHWIQNKNDRAKLIKPNS